MSLKMANGSKISQTFPPTSGDLLYICNTIINKGMKEKKYLHLLYFNGNVVKTFYNTSTDIVGTITTYNGAEYKVLECYAPYFIGNGVYVVPSIVGKVVGYKYHWVAYSADDSFTDESKGLFDTHKECYDDMRDNALCKMK
jgi:hypothetical protein